MTWTLLGAFQWSVNGRFSASAGRITFATTRSYAQWWRASLRRRREAIFGHVARMSPNIPAHHCKHWDYRSRHHSVDDLTAIGSAALVVLATVGSINSISQTISAHLLTYGEQPSGVVTLERRYGPRRLRDDDDDDDDAWLDTLQSRVKF